MPEWIPLPPEVELALIHAAKAGCVESRNKLIVFHRRLLNATTARIVGGHKWREYLAVGMAGFINAIRRYDPKRGTKFASYAAASIRWSILGELAFERRYHDRFGTNDARSDQAHAPDPPDRESFDELLRFVAELPDMECEVIVSRLMGDTLAAIGMRLSLTKERVRQIEMKATNKLRIKFGQQEGTL